MNTEFTSYFIASVLVCGAYLWWHAARDRRFRKIQLENIDAGLTEPASLHPVVDPTICIGCGSCVAACPEQDSHPVLGIIRGKAVLVEPTSCIGHGACKAACPVNAISLVFGTATRGVDIPAVSEDFETNIPGLFIAGELGGMGLIRNAIEQGRQAVDAIAKKSNTKKRSPNNVDVVIVGAGPAGLSASLRAKELGLKFVTIEQDSLGGTVFQFPRGKLVMTAPVNLPIVGKVNIRETSKEALLAMWTDVVAQTNLTINFQETVKDIKQTDKGFDVISSQTTYSSSQVLLTIGRRGTPRKLGVPGEELPKVVYRLIDPEQYRGQKTLVVGGGDSALEAALSIAEEPGTQVTLSYRSDAFGRAKAKNRAKVEAAEATGKITVMFNSNVKNIGTSEVQVEQKEQLHTFENDAVIISAGGVLPTGFLKNIGIEVETKHGTS